MTTRQVAELSGTAEIPQLEDIGFSRYQAGCHSALTNGGFLLRFRLAKGDKQWNM
jgi:hypothetical protein